MPATNGESKMKTKLKKVVTLGYGMNIGWIHPSFPGFAFVACHQGYGSWIDNYLVDINTGNSILSFGGWKISDLRSSNQDLLQIMSDYTNQAR